jgi:hypothetical protein
MVFQNTLNLNDNPRGPHIQAELRGDQWFITGETWLRRRTFARYGGEWQDKERAWVFGMTLVPEVRELVSVWLTAAESVPAADSAPAAVLPVASALPVAPGALPGWFVAPSWWKLVQIFLQHRPAIAIVGPAGNGKTTTVEMALQCLGMGFVSLSCTDRTEVVDLTGGTVLTLEGEQWRDGLVTRAFREGLAVVLDEADAMDPRVMLALQNALQDGGVDGKGRFVNTPAGRVYPAGACPIIFCMNTHGEGGSRSYNGRNKLDAASMDRFSVITTTYEHEQNILMARGYKRQTAREVVMWAEKMRERLMEAGMSLTLSPRTLLRIAQGVEVFGWEMEYAVEVEFFARMDKQRQEVLR